MFTEKYSYNIYIFIKSAIKLLHTNFRTACITYYILFVLYEDTANLKNDQEVYLQLVLFTVMKRHNENEINIVNNLMVEYCL